ncbi:carbohydrate ABC transporter permease [Pseudofrankia inefficax]|uniref:Binding-protein-dependent transport systems inner membrane component n=1 Tax=Pseudofrankia inefficax (strain DSM 45817 / CECT 9037 / DDB 130130 / EuI1c) TaxID=298654 RepID=E3IY96_PSEI1|nr:sugar ABC transporter permease [Pseudofrankia inefficax]ADP82694.1 binding-protein-dependent transport systems inner membrane component [Pseudofrankia inefficax]
MFVELAAPAALTGAGRTVTAVSQPVAARPALARRLLAAAPPYLYLLPAVACLVLWTYKPLVEAVQLSFYDWNLLPTSPMTYVGFHKYAEVFTQPGLRRATLNTVYYILGLLPFSVALPTVIALVTRRLGGRSRNVYRAIVFLPMLVAPVAAAAVWNWLLDPTGLSNQALGWFGVAPHNWLRTEGTALPAILAITAWSMCGFATLVVSAGLTGISADYGEAAAIDGATGWQILRWVTLPLLRSTLLFLVLMTVLLSGQWTFPLLDSLTQGGPGDSSSNVYYLLWELGFRNFDAGLASAAGIVFFLVFGLIAAALVALADRFSFHDN